MIKPYAVGLDVGYSGVKVACESKTLTFPSAVGKRENLDLADTAQSNASLAEIEVEGEKYLFGESALRLTKAVHRETRDYQNTREWYVLLLAALTELDLPNGAQIVLGTGLPVSFWTKEVAREMRTSLEGLHEVVKKGSTYRFHISRVVVKPQFYGAAMTALMQNQEVAHYLQGKRPVAIADGGGRTWNFGLLSEMMIVTGSTFSKDMGAWNAAKALGNALSREYGRVFEDHEVMESLLTRKVWNYGEEDITSLVEPVLDELAEPILRVFNEDWEKVIPTASALYFTGGTPLLLGERLSNLHPKTFYGKETDNAVGYKLFAELKRDQG